MMNYSEKVKKYEQKIKNLEQNIAKPMRTTQIGGTKLTVEHSEFKGLGKEGDFMWMIDSNPHDKSTFYIFNDNVEQHFTATSGGGNATIRPVNKYRLGSENARSAGIPTGSYNTNPKSPGFLRLNDIILDIPFDNQELIKEKIKSKYNGKNITVQNFIDFSILEIIDIIVIKYIAGHPVEKIIYSGDSDSNNVVQCGKKFCRILGSGIFNVNSEVLTYITQQIHTIPEKVQSILSSRGIDIEISSSENTRFDKKLSHHDVDSSGTNMQSKQSNTSTNLRHLSSNYINYGDSDISQNLESSHLYPPSPPPPPGHNVALRDRTRSNTPTNTRRSSIANITQSRIDSSNIKAPHQESQYSLQESPYSLPPPPPNYNDNSGNKKRSSTPTNTRLSLKYSNQNSEVLNPPPLPSPPHVLSTGPQINLSNVKSNFADYTVTIEGIPYTGKNKSGDFHWMIQNPKYNDCLFIYNENAEEHLIFSHGIEGTSSIIKFTNIVGTYYYNTERVQSAGIIMGPRPGEAYRYKNSESINMILLSILSIRELCAKNRYNRIIYSCELNSDGSCSDKIGMGRLKHAIN